MIVIKGAIRIKPDAREAAIAAGNAVSEASEAEAGCVSYRFAFDTREPDLVHLFEVWESDDALSAHSIEPHFTEFMAKVPDLVAGAVDVTRYDIAKSGPLF